MTFGCIFSKKKDSVFLFFADFLATLFHSLLYSAKMERHTFYKTWNSERHKSHRDLNFFVWLGDMFGYVSCLKHSFLSLTMCPGNHLKQVSNFLWLIWYLLKEIILFTLNKQVNFELEIMMFTFCFNEFFLEEESTKKVACLLK